MLGKCVYWIFFFFMIEKEMVYKSDVVASSNRAGRKNIIALSIMAWFPLLKLSFQTLLWRKLSAHPVTFVCCVHGILAEARTILHLHWPLLPDPNLDSSEMLNNIAFFPNTKVNPPVILGLMLRLKSYCYWVLTLQGSCKMKPLITVVVGLERLKYFTSWPQAKQFPDTACFGAGLPG